MEAEDALERFTSHLQQNERIKGLFSLAAECHPQPSRPTCFRSAELWGHKGPPGPGLGTLQRSPAGLLALAVPRETPDPPGARLPPRAAPLPGDRLPSHAERWPRPSWEVYRTRLRLWLRPFEVSPGLPQPRGLFLPDLRAIPLKRNPEEGRASAPRSLGGGVPADASLRQPPRPPALTSARAMLPRPSSAFVPARRRGLERALACRSVIPQMRAERCHAPALAEDPGTQAHETFGHGRKDRKT